MKFLEPAWNIRDRFNYGDLMYMSVGMAMEEASGKLWEDFISENVLKPLNMNNTNFSVLETQALSNFANPYIEKKRRS